MGSEQVPGEQVQVRKGLPTRPYVDMTTEELCKCYSPRKWTVRNLVPDEIIGLHMEILAKESEKAWAEAPFSKDVPYGDTEKQKMDILMPDSLPTDGPIFIYIHGGYWHLLGRELSSFMALPIYKTGGAYIAIGYDLSPQVSMFEIVRQVKEAVKYVLHLAKRRGSRGVYMGGHSAGGHLAAMMLSVDWMTEAPGTADLIKGAACFGGMFDVRPMVRATENELLQLNEDTAWELSPFNCVHKIHNICRNVHVLLANGTAESPEFIRQSLEYHQALQDTDVLSTYITIPDGDHFSLVEGLCRPQYSLTQDILAWMGLRAAKGTNIVKP